MIDLLRIATTREQARRLIDAGVNPLTSDMHFRGDLLVLGNYYPAPVDGVSPAWSMSALWDIMHGLDKTYDFDTSKGARDTIELLVRIICNRLNQTPIFEDED